MGKAGGGWLGGSPGKRWTEVFFLAYSPFWIAWALCVLVPFRLYDRFSQLDYLATGLAAALPCVLLPLLLQPAIERKRPWHRRYWVKANLWIAVFSYVGNYFWTHYFFELLGARYTFESWRLNDVPIALYFMTHAYFCFYFALGNVCIRRARTAVARRGPAAQRLATAAVVFGLSYATAYGETLTIAHFPHYSFQDKGRMYSVGSLFYAIYFFVGFPLFWQMDEDGRSPWSLRQALRDALAAAMGVTVLLDAWRLAFGGIVAGSGSRGGLVWTRGAA